MACQKVCKQGRDNVKAKVNIDIGKAPSLYLFHTTADGHTSWLLHLRNATGYTYKAYCWIILASFLGHVGGGSGLRTIEATAINCQ